jgi:hypothetical protein
VHNAVTIVAVVVTSRLDLDLADAVAAGVTVARLGGGA